MNEAKIQAYVFGELSPTESEEVALAISRDPQLREAERRYRLIREGFRNKRIQDMQEMLIAHEQTLPSPEATPPPSPKAKEAPAAPFWRKWWWVILAVVALPSLLLYFTAGKATEVALANTYYISPPPPGVAGTEDQSDVYQRGVDAFFAEDYAAARRDFFSLLEDDYYSSSARFYLPHAAFQLGDYPAATELFNAALADEDQPAGRRTLLHWNAMINDLARGEDIRTTLEEQEWPPNYPAGQLERELDAP